ncbi:MAG TPA: glycosyltransferase family 1 protein [Thermoanaerobaculia bacterium]|nr:glycosyltransferase family 1 protein [Thermoanaerobaculia bacterium]
MRLLQIAPARGADGVGGYAQRLGEGLAARGIAVDLLASRPGEERGEALPARTAAALDAALERWWGEGEGPAGVLLHYAGYGYQERGCPLWLAAGISRWLARGGERRVSTFFHEVSAFGRPWQSSFWLSPVQRRLAATLAGASRGIATSLPLYRDVLHRWLPRRAIAVLPVFSAVGEPREVPPLAGRPRRLAVFGGAGTRRRAFRDHEADLAAACETVGAEEVLDVGPPAGGDVPAAIGGSGGRPVRRLGVLPAAEVEALLLSSVAGFLAYPPAFLPKSTIFAAYCANGVVPICAATGREGDGTPTAGEHYLPPRPAHPPTAAELEALAGRARAWYLEHSLERQVEPFRRLVFEDPR